MQIPKFFETFIPILDILKEGQTLSASDLRDKVIEKHYANLSRDLLEQKMDSGGNLLGSRIYWGKTYLKLAKLVEYPERGLVRITPKGHDVLNKGSLTLNDLKNDPDYSDRVKMVKSK
ncbi:MAG: winged helix-turn-helix domain-containing protein [Patescibacteria group bacterium]